MKTLTLLLLSFLTITANAAMSEYEIEMLKLEKERMAITREAFELQKINGVYARCQTLKLYGQYLLMGSCLKNNGYAETEAQVDATRPTCILNPHSGACSK